MKRMLVSCMAFVLAFGLLGMGGKPGNPEEITTISKISITDRDVLTRNKPLVVSFSSPMVESTKTGADVAAADMPFTLTPAVSGKGMWITEDTFAFTADKGYPKGKQFFVLFKDSLADRAGKPVRYLLSFRTEAMRVSKIYAGTLGTDNVLPVDLSFNQPITAQILRERLTAKDEATGEALKFTVAGENEASSQTVKITLGKYRPKVTLAIAKDGAVDPVGFVEDYNTTLALPQQGDSASHITVVTSSDKSKPSPNYISSAYPDEDSDGRMTATFYLYTRLAEQDQSQFISVSPKLAYTIEDSYRIRITEGIKPGMEVTVTLKPGLVDSDGRVLDKEKSDSISLGDRRPRALFAEPGSLLTPAYGSRVGVNLTNIDQVTLTLRRQYDNNLPFLSFENNDSEKLSRIVAFKTVPVEGQKNELQRRAIDVEALADGQRGVFFLELNSYVEEKRRNGSNDMSWRDRATRLVVISDIGITSRVFPSGITTFASSLATGKPMPGADVRVYSASNQLIAQGKTGPDGVFVHSRDSLWDEQLRPNVVTVSAGKDLSFLPLDYSSTKDLTDSGERAYLDKGYEAFLYTPRGVFRPGETVDVKAFVRDGKHMAPTPFPVVCAITSSRGLELGRVTTTLSDQGGGDFAFALPKSAPTGTYTATLMIPGQEKQQLGSVHFSVEDFVPPRLEVSVTPSAENLVGDATLPLNLSGQYLFGAPGAELKYELGFKLFPKLFSPKGFEGYIFGDGERKFDVQTNLKYLTGTLDENGKADVTFKSPGDWQPSSMMQVLLIGGVQEDGGRWVTQTGSINYFPTAYMLGLKSEDKAGFNANKPVSMKIAAVTPEGTVADAGKVAVSVTRVEGYWNTVRRDGRYTYVWNERQVPVQNLEVATKDGQGEFTFVPQKYGTYLVRGKAEKGEVMASTRVGVWGDSEGGSASDEGAGRMDQVELAFDKPEYRAGEIAKLSVKAPYAGTLLLGIERGAQLSTRTIVMDKPAAIIDVPVTAEMDPNATVTAWVFRPVSRENKQWYAHRAYGSASLNFSKQQYTLKVEATTPERAAPSKPLSVPFTVKDAAGKPVKGEFSVALIDEGILSLTAFRTPDPLNYFMAKRRSVGQSYDAYDLLLKPEAKATAPLIPGGDGSGDYYGSLSTQQIFLVSYMGTVRTDENGRGEAQFDIPEYSGKGRLMIVGASGKSFASGASPVRFARDIVVEATAPRAVAPGDTFDVTIKSFTLANNLKGNANITVSATGPLTLSGEAKTTLPLDGKGAKTITVKATAQKEHAVAAITVNVSVAGRDDLTFSKRLEVVVRPPFPRTSAVQSALIKAGSDTTLTLPGVWLKGSVKASLSVDKSPVLAILPALDYLREYPYGCLEQTTSRAWPYLTLAAVENALHPEVDATANIKSQLSGIVARIATMQTAEGGFSMWPGGRSPDPWKSVHAAFFLVEAKPKVSVPTETLTRAVSYLKFLLAAPEGYFDSEKTAYTTKAYAAFVLTRAGETPLSWLQFLTEHQKEMLPSGTIFLAAAKSLHAGNPKALSALDAKKLVIDPKKTGYNQTLESDLRNLSLRLLAWSYVAPTQPETMELAKTVAEKIAAQKWFTTQEAGMAALALGTYLEKTDLQNSHYSAEITAAGKKLATAESGKQLVLNTAALPFTATGAPAPVTVNVTGDGQAYAVYSVRGVSLDAPKPSQSSLAVSRVWKNAAGEILDLTKGPIKIKKGERITVELSVQSTREVADVALSDLLPGGLEVENPRLKTAAGASDDDSDSASREGASPERGEDAEGDSDGEASPPSLYGTNLDLREDRLLLFFGRVSNSPETYSYTLRAVSKGTFILPPLAAEGMYNPEVNAITASGVVIVE